MRHILKCKACGSYTLSEKCKCGSESVKPGPAKYSPHDLYGKYRRTAKEPERKGKGLI